MSINRANKFGLTILSIFLLFGCCKSDELPSLINKLYSSSTKVRNDSALAIARCGSKASDAVPRLSELLYDENIGVQSSAAYALRRIDTPAARSILDKIETSRRRK